MTTAIQFVLEATGRANATEMFSWLQEQDCYLGGRVLEPGAGKPRWRVQVFFEDVPGAEWLPDGCRRVTVLPGQRKMLGL